MGNYLVGCALILMGLAYMVFHNRLGQWTIRQQNKTWGFRFSEKSTRITSVIYVFFGFLFVGLGILVLSGVINFE